MTNDATKMYCVIPPPSDQREVTPSDSARIIVEYIGNIDVVFRGRSDEPITLCDGLEAKSFFIPQGPADARYYFRCSRSTHRGRKSYLPMREE